MKKQPKYGSNVILTGFTSFFTDVSSEMIYPLLQAFIAVIMKAQATFLGPVLGIIEGIAESTASLLKVFSGYYSDRIQKRKTPVIFGYSLSMLAKILYFIPFWTSVLFARIFDRIGKGIRTAPRDALISESTPKKEQGKAFGFQRGMDFAGAFLGSLLSFFLLKYIFPSADKMNTPQAFYPIFMIALVPALIGVIFLFFIKEKKVHAELNGKVKPKPNLNFRKYDKNLQIFFLALFIFTIGNSSNQFLLLRSTELLKDRNPGSGLSSVILMYIIFNLASSLFSSSFGKLSDKIGRKKLLISGYVLYSIVYLAFGFIKPGSDYLLWIFWPVYGIYYAMTEGVEKAFVSDISPRESKATALGFYNTIVGVGLLPASLIAGLLFSYIPASPFIFGGIMSLISIVIIGFLVKETYTYN